MNNRSTPIRVSLVRLAAPLVLPLIAGLLCVASAIAEPPKIFQRLFSAKPIENASTSGGILQTEDGPWMILAHTFVGPNSSENAERLSTELHQSFDLPTFIYKENFDFMQGPNSSSTAVRRVRYANPHEYETHSVLVGEYDTEDHPSLEGDLKRIKIARPAIFSDQQVTEEETNTRSPITAIKAIQRKWASASARKGDSNGPMHSAFLTRNPILPPEYFQRPKVDRFVEQLNRDIAHSLLESDGSWTVIVRTFEGYGSIANGRFEDRFKPSVDRLDQCARDANKMTMALRKKGVEAFQFHDREKSIVTVGSFATLGRALPDGTFEYTPEILQVVNDYRAFNVRPELAAQGPTGRNEHAANNIENIPFDVQPIPIAVPIRDQRGMLSRALRR